MSDPRDDPRDDLIPDEGPYDLDVSPDTARHLPTCSTRRTRQGEFESEKEASFI